mgnify:CR=1 FL=1
MQKISVIDTYPSVTDRQWVSYDNEISITMKCNFVKKHGLGGAMIWSLDFDDFTGETAAPKSVEISVFT